MARFRVTASYDEAVLGFMVEAADAIRAADAAVDRVHDVTASLGDQSTLGRVAITVVRDDEGA